MYHEFPVGTVSFCGVILNPFPVVLAITDAISASPRRIKFVQALETRTPALINNTYVELLHVKIAPPTEKCITILITADPKWSIDV